MSETLDDLSDAPDDIWEILGDVTFAIDRASFAIFDIFPASDDVRVVQSQ